MCQQFKIVGLLGEQLETGKRAGKTRGEGNIILRAPLVLHSLLCGCLEQVKVMI